MVMFLDSWRVFLCGALSNDYLGSASKHFMSEFLDLEDCRLLIDCFLLVVIRRSPVVAYCQALQVQALKIRRKC
jgi:hypothetical protein